MMKFAVMPIVRLALTVFMSALLFDAGRDRRLIAYGSFQALFAESVLYDWRLL
jgi:hypothetical protein